MAIYITLGVVVLALFGFVTVFAAMFRHAAGLDLPSRGWLDELSPDKYAPLSRLFDPADIASLSTHRGYTEALGRKLASARRRAARLFLSELTADFNRLFRVGREMLAHSAVERPDLASLLFQQWFAFHAQVLSLRIRLRLAPLGFAPGRPGEIVETLARLRSELLSVPAAA